MMSSRQRTLIEFVLDNLVWFLLVFVLAVFSAVIPNFFQIGIFANIIEQSTFVGVMAIGLAIVIIAGHMDLSVESVAALTAMVTGILFCSHGIGLGVTLSPEWLIVPVSLLLAMCVGGCHWRRQRLACRPASNERLHRNAGLLYLGARPCRCHFRRALRPRDCRLRSALSGLIRLPSSRSSPGLRWPVSPSSPLSWPRRLLAATSR